MSMQDIEQMEQREGTQLFTADQRDAAAFLEKLGLRFLIEYGVSNCESKALQLGWQRPATPGPGKPVLRLRTP